MRVIVVGLGIQGKKRASIAQNDLIATVDPISPSANYKQIQDVPVESYDAVLLCTPDEVKEELIEYCLSHDKHVLVEKPLLVNAQKTTKFSSLSSNAICYTAYNHRFEPHFMKMKELLDSGDLGKIYSCRMFYGNGTARDVRNSPWRDKGTGVIKDLGSHLLDTVLFWFNDTSRVFTELTTHCFENNAPDHAIFHSEGSPYIQLEMTLLSWRNHFTCDIFAEHGSAHIESLCKWGPSQFILRKRALPSGRPTEQVITLVQPDPTWELEYEHFKELCKKGMSNISNDVWITKNLREIS